MELKGGTGKTRALGRSIGCISRQLANESRLGGKRPRVGVHAALTRIERAFFGLQATGPTTPRHAKKLGKLRPGPISGRRCCSKNEKMGSRKTPTERPIICRKRHPQRSSNSSKRGAGSYLLKRRLRGQQESLGTVGVEDCPIKKPNASRRYLT